MLSLNVIGMMTKFAINIKCDEKMLISSFNNDGLTNTDFISCKLGGFVFCVCSLEFGTTTNNVMIARTDKHTLR